MTEQDQVVSNSKKRSLSLKGLGFSESQIDLIYRFSPVIAVFISLVIGAFLIMLTGINPLQAYLTMLYGAFGTPRSIGETLLQFTPLLLGGLGTLIAFKTSCFNVGGVGQIYMGGLAAIGVAYVLAQIFPLWIPNVFIAMFASFMAGGFLAFIPAFLKTQYKTSEVVSSVMLNYIAQYFCFWAIGNIFHIPGDFLPWSWAVPANAKLPQIFFRLNIGFIIALLAIPAVYLLFKRVSLGYEMRATGLNAKAASCAGINTTRSVWVSMFLCGGLFGLVGWIEVLGAQFRFAPEWVADIGFSAIPVAILGNLDPLGTVLAALFYGVLARGGEFLQLSYPVPGTLVDAIQAIMLILILVSQFLKVRRARMQ